MVKRLLIMDFTNFKFRCHSIGKVMTYPNKNSLSSGAKTFLGQVFKEQLYGKTNDIKSKYIDKGLLVEEEAIKMYSYEKGVGYEKNLNRFENEYLSGEPDIIDEREGFLLDIKSSWDHSTFPLTSIDVPKKEYYWQMQAYMDLTDIDRSILAYCLVDTPDELIHDEIRRVRSKLGLLELPEELEDNIWDGLRFNNIDPSHRIKEFLIDKNQEDIELMHQRIILSREYLNNLSNLILKS